MRLRFLLGVGAVLVTAGALAQPRIISFDTIGHLTWTNSVAVGFYQVESAASPTGSWNALGTVADLDTRPTNHISFPVSLSNASSFYRVGLLPPKPIGIWDYYGYDTQGTIVITGRLDIASMTLLSSNPVVYTVQGTRNLEYNGPPTNAPWWLGPQFGSYGTGDISGRLELYARLRFAWPTNTIDFNVQLFGTVGPNNYTGTWYYYTSLGPYFGPFNATKRP